MKKLMGLLLTLILLAGCLGALGEASVSFLDDPSFEEADGQAEGNAPAETQQPQPAATGKKPAVRWLYPVSMLALHSEYNKLVNRDNLLDEDYAPDDLVKVTVKRATAAAVLMRREANEALDLMFEAAKLENMTLFLKSGYRSYGTQKTMYNNRVESMGKDDGVVTYPGASEHQTGLACDILNADYAGRPRMTTDFAETQEAKWMKENCASFGFVLRYPDEKTDITQIIFEPWHFRYVGKEVAMYVMREGLTLEEFFDEWQMAVAEFQGQGGNIDEEIAYEEARKNAGPESVVLDIFGDDGDAEVSLTF